MLTFQILKQKQGYYQLCTLISVPLVQNSHLLLAELLVRGILKYRQQILMAVLCNCESKSSEIEQDTFKQPFDVNVRPACISKWTLIGLNCKRLLFLVSLALISFDLHNWKLVVIVLLYLKYALASQICLSSLKQYHVVFWNCVSISMKP